MKKYHFYSDPGHGWLKVSIKELIKLGIAEKITGYSYRKGNFAYLEEDCDVSTFADSKKISPKDFENHIYYHSANKMSKIRNYSSYYYSKEKEEYYNNLRNIILKLKDWNNRAIKQINNASYNDLDFWKKHYGITLN